jgi:hypothetical protein
MWPDLFGPGWVWGAMLAAGLAAVLAGAAVMTIRATEPAAGTQAADPALRVWHRYEQGDLTEWEFARLLRARAAVEPAVVFAGRGRGPVSDPPAPDDAAAD